MAQEARMAAGAAKSKGAESFPICPLCKNIFVLHPRFPHLFGGVLVFPYQIENSRPVLRQYRFAGRVEHRHKSAGMKCNGYKVIRQHRTIPALPLKHRSGSCGTASALPKCSIMSGCGTRIVLQGQKPLALSATAAPASARCFRHWRRSPLQHPVLSALLAWHLPHLARRIGT